jgi:hypothetical protein
VLTYLYIPASVYEFYSSAFPRSAWADLHNKASWSEQGAEMACEYSALESKRISSLHLT